jgi:hypothetical protein
MKHRLTTCCGIAALVGYVALAGCQVQARTSSPSVVDAAGTNRVGAATPDNASKMPITSPDYRRQILVKFKPRMQAAQIEQFRARFGTRNVGRIDGLDVWVEEVPAGQSVAETIRAMLASGDVEYAEENQEVSIGGV